MADLGAVGVGGSVFAASTNAPAGGVSIASVALRVTGVGALEPLITATGLVAGIIPAGGPLIPDIVGTTDSTNTMTGVYG